MVWSSQEGLVIAAVVQRLFRNDVIVIDDEAETNIAAAVLCVNVATHTGRFCLTLLY